MTGKHAGARRCHAMGWPLLAACCLAVTACADVSGTREVKRHNRKQFDSEVYPVLLRDCALHRGGARSSVLLSPGSLATSSACRGERSRALR